MHWADPAIVLSRHKYGETSAVVRVFARDHGLYGGVARGAFSKANRGIYEPGNRVLAHWSARLAEHLGTLKAELTEPVAALVMGSATRLAALAAACALLEASMHEREAHPVLYDGVSSLLDALVAASGDWPTQYVRFEMDLLRESGFGLDLKRCAATGNAEDLCYVSPRSGRAVSREAGAPYHDKMLPLPSFLSDRASATPAEIADGLRLTGYFLEHRLFAAADRRLPPARQRFVEQAAARIAVEIAD